MDSTKVFLEKTDKELNIFLERKNYGLIFFFATALISCKTTRPLASTTKGSPAVNGNCNLAQIAPLDRNHPSVIDLRIAAWQSTIRALNNSAESLQERQDGVFNNRDSYADAGGSQMSHISNALQANAQAVQNANAAIQSLQDVRQTVAACPLQALTAVQFTCTANGRADFISNLHLRALPICAQTQSDAAHLCENYRANVVGGRIFDQKNPYYVGDPDALKNITNSAVTINLNDDTKAVTPCDITKNDNATLDTAALSSFLPEQN